MVERALAALMPATRTDTYAAPAMGAATGYGQRAFGAYGSAGRSSGEFRMSAA